MFRLSSLFRLVLWLCIVSGISEKVILFYFILLLFGHRVEVNASFDGMVGSHTSSTLLLLLNHSFSHFLRNYGNVQEAFERWFVALRDARQLKRSQRIQLGLAVHGKACLQETCISCLRGHCWVNWCIDIHASHWASKRRQLLREVAKTVETLVLLLENVLLCANAVLNKLRFVEFGVLWSFDIWDQMGGLGECRIARLPPRFIMKRCHC